MRKLINEFETRNKERKRKLSLKKGGEIDENEEIMIISDEWILINLFNFQSHQISSFYENYHDKEKEEEEGNKRYLTSTISSSHPQDQDQNNKHERIQSLLEIYHPLFHPDDNQESDQNQRDDFEEFEEILYLRRSLAVTAEACDIPSYLSVFSKSSPTLLGNISYFGLFCLSGLVVMISMIFV